MFSIHNEESDTIVFHTHQGHGDLIACSPIANFLAETFTQKKVIYAVKSESHAKNIKRFCRPGIEVRVFENYADHEHLRNFVVRSGFSLVSAAWPFIYGEFWDSGFYERSGVDYSVKSKSFYIERNFENERKILNAIQSTEPYGFVHDDPERGYSFTPNTELRVVRNLPDVEIADMACVLENAAELHLMGSSLLCLADLMGLPHERQAGHYYRFRDDSNSKFRGIEKWNVI